MLLLGDVIAGRKTLDDTSLFVCLVLDNGNLMQMAENGCEIIGGDMTVPVLDSLLAMHTFAVLRPSLAIK